MSQAVARPSAALAPRGSRAFTAAGVATACTVGNLVSSTPMVNSVFGVFLAPLSQAFGWPRSGVSGVLLVIAIVGVLSYPIVGRIADRYGARRTILIGNLLFGASIAALSLLNGRVWQVYLLFTVVGVTAAIPSTVLFGKVVAGWFVKRRGLMLGVTAGVGNGLGATVAPGIAAFLLTAFGWRGAYLGLGLIIAGLGFPILLAGLRDPPSTPADDPAIPAGASLSAAQARRTPTFWIIAVAAALGAGSLTALFTHSIVMLVDRHISMGVATSVLMAFAFSGTVWQLAMGYLLDRTRTPRLAAPFFILAIVGVAILSRATSPGLLVAGGLLAGLGVGAEYGLLPYALPRYFGLGSYGEIYGVIYGLIVLTMGVAPVLMDVVFDHNGTYDIALIAIGFALAIAAGLIACLPTYRYTVQGALLEQTEASPPRRR